MLEPTSPWVTPDASALASPSRAVYESKTGNRTKPLRLHVEEGKGARLMTTHADLAAKLLREAAVLFRAMSGMNEELTQKLDEFAGLYEQVANLVEADPLAVLQPADGAAG